MLQLSEALNIAGPDDRPVGILLPGDSWYVVTVLACLLVGRVAVLLDASFPAARNHAIVAASGVSLLVTFLGMLDTSFGRAAGGESLTWRQWIRSTYRSLLRTVLSWHGLRSSLCRTAAALPPSAAHQVERYLVGVFRQHAHHAWKPVAIDIPIWFAVSDESAPVALKI